MKILFVMKYPINKDYSILQKLNGEMNAVRKLGHEVNYVSFDDESLYLNTECGREVIRKTTLGRSGFYYHTLVFRDIYLSVIKAIKTHKYDVVYFRYAPIGLTGKRMIKLLSQKAKIVVEIPTFPPNQEKQKTFLRRLYMRYSNHFWKKSARYIDLFTGIGEQSESFLNRPLLNIDNGVDVELIPLRKKRSDGKMHLLAVASMSKWQGYDRLIKGLSLWKDERADKYIIDLVGDDFDGSLNRWKELAKECNIEKQVCFHGKKVGAELTALFEVATIGIGSLSLFWKGINNSSILKIREYMARGLPFVYASNDPHIPQDAKWCLRVPNDDTPIKMQDIDTFITRLDSESHLEEKMRAYAEKNMTWEAQFKAVFRKLDLCK